MVAMIAPWVIFGGVLGRKREWRERVCHFSLRAPLSVFSSLLTDAAGKDERLTGDPGGLIGCKENRGSGDVLRLRDAAERRLRFGHLAEIAFLNAGGFKSLGFHHSRIQRIDSNLLRAELLGEGDGDCVYRC